jgi:hypothetical protein
MSRSGGIFRMLDPAAARSKDAMSRYVPDREVVCTRGGVRA